MTNYLVWRFIFKAMPLITTRFQKMWTHFKLSVPNLGEERIYLTRSVLAREIAIIYNYPLTVSIVTPVTVIIQMEAMRVVGQ